jgi:hypothetical protein
MSHIGLKFANLTHQVVELGAVHKARQPFCAKIEGKGKMNIFSKISQMIGRFRHRA